MKLQVVLWIIFCLSLNLRTANAQDYGNEEESETTTVDSETVKEETESPEIEINLDYSTLNLPYTAYPNGGVLVQYTQNGHNYIIGMVERAVLKVMTNFSIPDTVQDDFSLKNVKINEFQKPRLLSKFVNQTGIEISIVMPKLEISADYSASVGWLSSNGIAKCSVKNLVISMLMRIDEGRQGIPAIKLPLCQGTVETFRIVFSDRGWGGTILNSLRGLAESIVTSSLGDVVCFKARNMTDALESIFLDWEKPINEDQPTMDTTVMCGEDIKKKQASKGSGAFDSMVKEIKGMTIDMNTNGSAFFEPDQMVVGLRGDFALNGTKTGLKPKPLVLPHTDRMICFAVKEVVMNSFGVIAHQQRFIEYNNTLATSELSSQIFLLVKAACATCQLQLYASTKEPIRVKFASTGVKLFISASISISGKGIFGPKITVVEAIFETESLVKLVVDKQHLIKGSVDMDYLNIKIVNYGIIGILLDKPLNALLRQIIPKLVWPLIRWKVNRMINEKGFELPEMCGLSFNRTEIKYVEGSVIVATDFLYDLEGFLDRYMANKRQKQMNTDGLAETPSPSLVNPGDVEEETTTIAADDS